MTTTASPWVAKAAAAGLALAALMASGAAQARGDVHWSISLNSPGMYGPPVYVAPAPVYVAPPQPIYYAPRRRSTTRRAPSTVLRPSWSFPATDTAMVAATGVDTVASTAMAMATGMATGAVDLS
ncbi:hypothetical protein CLV01_2394 [Delftia sp. 60]|nr:hypothetical protein CLV01_2394 [Delftia sp. 60]